MLSFDLKDDLKRTEKQNLIGGGSDATTLTFGFFLCRNDVSDSRPIGRRRVDDALRRQGLHCLAKGW